MESCSISLHCINADRTLSKDRAGVNFYPEDKVDSNWMLLGRATAIVGANMPGEDNSWIAEGEHMEIHGKVGGKVEDNHDAGLGTTEGDASDAGSDKVDGELDEELRTYYQARNEYWEAYNNIVKTHNLVLKISWPETSRPEEWRIIGCAQVLGTNNKLIKGHILEVKCAWDLDCYSTEHI